MSGSGNMRELILPENENPMQPEEKKGKAKRVVMIILIVIAAALVAALIALFYYSRVEYKNRWYPHSTLNGVDVSGMTLEESRAAVIDRMENYSLTVNGREDGKLVIQAEDIDYHVQLSDQFEKSFNEEQTSKKYIYLITF
jgi:flagellar basal body-associated protein FliL